MSTDSDLVSDFDQKYPTAFDSRIRSLFKFYGFNREEPGFTKVLFLDKKLHHSSPNDFNDPFKCKPHFTASKTHQSLKSMVLKTENSPHLQDLPRDERIMLGVNWLIIPNGVKTFFELHMKKTSRRQGYVVLLPKKRAC